MAHKHIIIKIMKELNDYNNNKPKFLVQYRNICGSTQSEYIIRIIMGYNYNNFIQTYIRSYAEKQTDLNGLILNDILKLSHIDNKPLLDIVSKFFDQLELSYIDGTKITLERFYDMFVNDILRWNIERGTYFEELQLDQLKCMLNISCDNIIIQDAIV
jgi:hypothetical protein